MFANAGYYTYDPNGYLCYVVGNGVQYNYPNYWYNSGVQYNYPNYWYRNNGAYNYPSYGYHCGTCGAETAADNRAWNNGWR